MPRVAAATLRYTEGASAELSLEVAPSMSRNLDWLSGGGEMGALIRTMDWGQTALGPVESWPQSLRTTVSLCLSSTFPILIAWGPDRVQLYNDAYRPICGEKHPRSMGQAFNECWASALPAVGKILDRAQAGEGSYLENLPMVLDRYGYLEEAFMTFSFSPIRDESGGVGGLFHPITEVTDKMLSARRTLALQALSGRLSSAKSMAEIAAALAECHAELEADVPFLSLYEFDEGARLARCTSAAGFTLGSAGCPVQISLEPGSDDVWPLARVLAHGGVQVLGDAHERVGDARCGPYPEAPRSAVLLPVQPAGMIAPMACMVAGVSARRALDPAYRAFFEQLGAAVTAAVSNVLAYEQEQRRVEALAEIDRAKTAFFSNVSHEFRTPLTLMLGPLEDALDDHDHRLPAAQRERVVLVRRSGLRLLKLVNTLLDFSRIEAGRAQASYEVTDLATVTRDVASVFRSTVERAGLTLDVACSSPAEPVWVDREMWEKILLNLLSNAFKHTFDGRITVRLNPLPGEIELVVSDTGVGIPEAELPRLFERFHRVQDARGRSYEGSGIGLALVHELVRLHGGSVRVESVVERGTTFTIRIPLGSAHLPSERLNAGRTVVSTATRAEAFVHEAASWTDGDGSAFAGNATSVPVIRAPGVASPRARVLLADDNADMRDYVARTLQERFVVESVADGKAAFAAARREPPDLIVSDVMMPVLDGFGLLRMLKADPVTAGVPVILLSARAGEEATLEGLQAGASDYMVKPFSARELSARVEGAIRTARAQQEAQRERAHLAAVLAALHEGVLFQDAEGVARYCNAASERLLRLSEAELSGRTSMDPRWGMIFEDGTPAPGDQHAPMLALRSGRPVVGQVLGFRAVAPEDREVWLRINAQPTFDTSGRMLGVVSSFVDITAERRVAREARERSKFEQQLIGIVSHDLRTPLNAVVLGSNLLSSMPDLAEPARKVIGRVRNSAERATRLVRDLLDFTQARVGSGIAIARDELDLDLCVQHSLEEVRTSYPARDVLYASPGTLQGQWDADRIAQIVHNLVSNALKYGDRQKPVHVRALASAHEVALEVHNEGEPISAELLPEIFEPFRRGASNPGQQTNSIGLGLFIVEHLVRAHGGTIRVRSTPEEGTTFTVRLPRG